MYERGEERNIIVVFALTMVTCGLYGLYYNYVLMQDLNKGLGREEYSPVKEIALGFVTCGFWTMWLLWREAASVNEIERDWGLKVEFEQPILFALNFFVFNVFSQVRLNNVWANGTVPGGSSSGSSADRELESKPVQDGWDAPKKVDSWDSAPVEEQKVPEAVAVEAAYDEAEKKRQAEELNDFEARLNQALDPNDSGDAKTIRLNWNDHEGKKE